MQHLDVGFHGDAMTDRAAPLYRIDEAISAKRMALPHRFIVLLFPVLLLGSLILTASLTHASEVAILTSAEVAYYHQAVQAFRFALPPDTTVTEYHLMGSLARGHEVAAQLRGAPPDLVLAVGLKAALVAKLELPETPTLFCLVLNPESHGLPTSNMTGISMRVAPEAQLSSIRTLAPQAKRIGLLYDPNRSGALVEEAQRAARKLGLAVTAVAVPNGAGVPEALRNLLPKIDLFWLLQDQTVVTQDSLDFILRTTLEAKVPVFGFSPTLVQQGALGALVIDSRDIGRQAGALASALLRDSGQFRQPLQDPLRPQLAVNLKTAEYLGLNPSREVLRLATLLYGGQGGGLVQREGATPPTQ
jgi:putative ABC transport system substrate-binding protein